MKKLMVMLVALGLVSGCAAAQYNEEAGRAAKQQAAEKGDAEAQNSLGLMYQKGEGAPQDDREAVKWFRKSAAQGHYLAQHNLGEMYAQGRGVQKNNRTAMEWFKKAAAQGHVWAQHNLGVMHLQGDGVPENYHTAAEWFHKAATQGHRPSQDALTLIVEGWKKAAAQGEAWAQHNLGLIYFKGYGVPQNDRTAVEWLQKAAAQGHKPSQDALIAIMKRGRM